MTDLRFVAVLTVGLLCATVGTGVGQEKAVGGQEPGGNTDDVKGHLNTIDSYSGSPDVKVRKAIEGLQSNPVTATPSLMECFGDKNRKQDSRMLCSYVLQQNASHLTANHKAQLLATMRDAKEQSFPRIDAAILLLKTSPAADVKKEIKQLGFRLYKDAKYREHIVMSVLNPLWDDPEVQEFFLKQIRDERTPSRGDGMIHLLGKKKCKALIGIIEKELKSDMPERYFTKVRMHLALGDIGGAKAYDVLIMSLARETNERERRQILRALGVTKDPRAKAVLIEYLQHKPLDYYTATLDGLKYLGDASAIPILEKELARNFEDPFLKQKLRSTIKAIQSGDDRPFW